MLLGATESAFPTWHAIGVLALAACAIGPIAFAAVRLRGTTLLPAALWSGAAVIAVCAVELAASQSTAVDFSWDALRLAAAALALCPAISVLGAKRPQHGVWQLIVFSLWIVLCLPIAVSLARGGGSPLRIDAVWSWFLAVLWGLGTVNYWPTRFGPASLLAAAGQSALLAPGLPLDVWPLPPAQRNLAGLALLAAAALLAAICRPRRPPGLQSLWLDFRDSFGAAWALRVAQRVNVTAQQQGYDVRLGWSGWHDETSGATGPIRADQLAACLQTLESLLGRFVSAEWIARRAPRTVDY